MEQQATNAALAALAKTGDSFALGQLWEINKGLLRSLFWKWYTPHKALADAHGLTVDDFELEGFFAVQYAAEHYDPARGSFATALGYAAQRQLRETLFQGHPRRIMDREGRARIVSRNPLDGSQSLDAPLDHEADITLGDTIADESVGIERAEDVIYRQQLHDELDAALDKLTDEEQATIRARFYKSKTIRETGEQLGVTPSRVRTIEDNGMRKLRMNPRLMRYREDYISTHAWHGTGFAAWSTRGSVEERTVEGLERLYDRQKSGDTQTEMTRQFQQQKNAENAKNEGGMTD